MLCFYGYVVCVKPAFRGARRYFPTFSSFAGGWGILRLLWYFKAFVGYFKAFGVFWGFGVFEVWVCCGRFPGCRVLVVWV